MILARCCTFLDSRFFRLYTEDARSGVHFVGTLNLPLSCVLHVPRVDDCRGCDGLREGVPEGLFSITATSSRSSGRNGGVSVVLKCVCASSFTGKRDIGRCIQNLNREFVNHNSNRRVTQTWTERVQGVV
jgi:hypothetical protein